MNELLALKAELEEKLKHVNAVLALLEKNGNSGSVIPQKAVLPPSWQKAMEQRAERTVSVKGPKVTNPEVRAVITSMSGEFRASDVITAVQSAYPNRDLNMKKVPAVLYQMRTDGLLQASMERSGRAGYKYSHKH